MNPFAELPGARELSRSREVQSGHQQDRLGEDIHNALRALLHDPDFPCVGAKSVINQSSYHFGLYPALADETSTAALAYDLHDFIAARPTMGGEFTSFIASFVEPKVRSSRQFERLLWQQLAALHQLDRQFFQWNREVSSDPADPGFSFSFGGQAFFVVGLSPASSRWARHFSWPTLVFNDHAAFQQLRAENRFDRLRDVIRERDEKLHGSLSVTLGDYGDGHSEARQYSGRQVSDVWRCPVHFEAEEKRQ